jgi:hypothetical protein
MNQSVENYYGDKPSWHSKRYCVLKSLIFNNYFAQKFKNYEDIEESPRKDIVIYNYVIRLSVGLWTRWEAVQ